MIDTDGIPNPALAEKKSSERLALITHLAGNVLAPVIIGCHACSWSSFGHRWRSRFVAPLPCINNTTGTLPHQRCVLFYAPAARECRFSFNSLFLSLSLSVALLNYQRGKTRVYRVFKRRVLRVASLKRTHQVIFDTVVVKDGSIWKSWRQMYPKLLKYSLQSIRFLDVSPITSKVKKIYGNCLQFT